MEDKVIHYKLPAPSKKDVEKANIELIRLVEELESTAYHIMRISSSPVFFDTQFGGRLRGYADIIQDVSTNISQTFNIYG